MSEPVSPDELVAAVADRLGVPPPSPTEVELLLSLAGTAAHASARTAAPIACYLVGRAGIDPSTAASIVADVADTLAGGER